MKTRQGDLIQLARQGQFNVIVHGCNCFCTMGAGIARQIKQQFPAAYEADLKTTKGDRAKLGSMSFAKCNNDIGGTVIVVNAYTQYHYGSNRRQVDYDAIRQVFQTIKTQFSGKSIAYPAIGAGLAGGDWAVIADIIDEALADENHTLVEYQPNY